MSPARARTRTTRSGDERTNHEATALVEGKVNYLARLVQKLRNCAEMLRNFTFVLLFASDQIQEESNNFVCLFVF